MSEPNVSGKGADLGLGGKVSKLPEILFDLIWKRSKIARDPF